jgi:hypothetical protein
MTHNMKGFVFTLDALFALVVAGIGVTLLMYLQYTSPGSFQTPVLESYSLLQSALHESIAGMCNNVSMGVVNGCTLASGTGLYSFGAYNAPPYQSALQTIANLYLNPQYGPYAGVLLNAVYPSVNTTMFINNIYAPSLNLESAIFNGQSGATIASNILISDSQVTTASGTYATFALWEYEYSSSAQQYLLTFSTASGGSTAYGLEANQNGCLAFHVNGQGDAYGASSSTLAGKWNFIVGEVYNGQETGNDILYVNGTKQTLSFCAGSSQGAFSAPYISIGAFIPSNAQTFNGLISNVQVYNGLLSSSQVSSLYSEGITGAPLTGANLIGWWPLDGNANDYTTYGNTGTPANVAYSASLSTYFPPRLSASPLVDVASVPMALNASGTAGVYNVSMVTWR